MKNFYFIIYSALFSLTYATVSDATTFTSTTTGQWEDGGTWGHTSPGIVGTDFPGAGDIAIVAAGHTVSVGATAACASLTIQSNGSIPSDGSVSVGAFTLTVSGDIDLTSTGSINAVTYGSPSISTSSDALSILTVVGDINFNYDNGFEIPSLTISDLSTLNIAGNLNVNGVYSSSYYFYGAPASIVNYNASSGSQTIIGGAYGILVFSGGGGTRVLDATGQNITITGVSTTCFQPNIGSGISYTNTNSTIDFSSTGNQTVPAFDYYNLTISGSRTPNNTVTFVNGGTIKVAGTVVLTSIFSGTTGGYINTNNTFTYNGTNPQTVVFRNANIKATYNNLTYTGSSSLTLPGPIGILNVKGGITVSSGTFSNGGNAIVMNASKTFTVGSGATFTMIGTTGMPTGTTLTYTLDPASTVNFAGTDQSISTGITYGSITLSGSGTKIFPAGTTTITGSYSSGGLAGLTSNSTTVSFNGSAAQTITGANTWYNLVLANTGGLSIVSGLQSIGNTLTLTSGTFTTTSSTLSLLSTASKTANIAGTIGNISGTITVQRYVSGSAGYRYLGAPVSCNISELQPDIRLDGMIGSTQPTWWCNVYKYNEATAGTFATGWAAETDVANPMTLGRGYAVYIYAANIPGAVTLDYAGAPNSGSQSLPVTFTSSSNADDGWNMVSNPYASAIDWDGAGWTRANIVGDAYYAWDNANTRYASYSLGSGVNGGTRYIASGQAFMVQAASGPVLSVTESAKVSNEPTPVFWKTESIPSALKLKISSAANSYEDEAIIRFMPGATANNDIEFDAGKLETTNLSAPSISTLTADAITTCINTYPNTTNDIVIPVKVRAGVTGNQKIEIEKLNYQQSNYIILEDLKTGAISDINTPYIFAMTADSTLQTRFLLHISTAPLSVSMLKNNISSINTYMAEDNLVIDLSASDANKYDIVVYNLMGQALHQINKAEAQNKIKLDLSGQPAGIYLVNFKSNQASQTKKINYTK